MFYDFICDTIPNMLGALQAPKDSILFAGVIKLECRDAGVACGVSRLHLVKKIYR